MEVLPSGEEEEEEEEEGEEGEEEGEGVFFGGVDDDDDDDDEAMSLPVFENKRDRNKYNTVSIYTTTRQQY